MRKVPMIPANDKEHTEVVRAECKRNVPPRKINEKYSQTTYVDEPEGQSFEAKILRKGGHRIRF